METRERKDSVPEFLPKMTLWFAFPKFLPFIFCPTLIIILYPKRNSFLQILFSLSYKGENKIHTLSNCPYHQNFLHCTALSLLFPSSGHFCMRTETRRQNITFLDLSWECALLGDSIFLLLCVCLWRTTKAQGVLILE